VSLGRFLLIVTVFQALILLKIPVNFVSLPEEREAELWCDCGDWFILALSGRIEVLCEQINEIRFV
jgi:hypothetical protein